MRRFFRKRLPAFLLTLVMVMTMVPAVSARSSVDLEYKVEAGETVSFDLSKFTDYYEENKDDHLSYLRFTDVTGLDSCGQLYAYDYSREEVGLDEDDLESACFYVSRSDMSRDDYRLNGMSFLAGKRSNGETVDLAFQMRGDDGGKLKGTLRITIGKTSSASKGDITYAVKPGEETAFDVDDFEQYYDDHCSGNFKYVTFSSSTSKYKNFSGYIACRGEAMNRAELVTKKFYKDDSDYGDDPIKRLTLAAIKSASEDRVEISFTVYGERKKDSADGTLVLEVSKSGSSTSTKGDITYTVKAGEEVAFNDADFEKIYANSRCTGSLKYVMFDRPSSSDYANGAVYFRYDKRNEKEFTRSGLSSNKFYYEDSDYGDYDLNELSFVAEKSFSGSMTLQFTLYGGKSGKDDQTTTATLIITSGKSDSAKSDITYTVKAGEKVEFNADDFDKFYSNSSCTGSLKYVEFSRPDSAFDDAGTIYSRYGKRSETAFSRSDLRDNKFYYDDSDYGDYDLEELSFVADKSFSGSVTLNFTAYGGKDTKTNQTVSGTLSITTTETPRYIGNIRYNTTPGTALQINANDIARFFRKYASGEPLVCVTLTGVPATGSLYYNYYNTSKYGTAQRTQLTATTAGNVVFSYSPASASEYDLSELTYIPSGSNYCTAFSFTGYSSSGTTVSGTILISVTTSPMSEVYCVTTKGTSVNFPASAVYSAVKTATGAGLTSIQLLDLPAAKAGALYVGSYAADVTSAYNYGNGIVSMNQLRFVPKSGFTGPVTIPYVALDSDGAALGAGVVSIGVVGNMERFTDISTSTWCYKYVTELAGADVISGYSNGTFQEKNIITYGAALKLIMLAAGYGEQAPTVKDSTFSGYLAKAKATGLVSGNPKLSGPITRLQIAQIAAKALKLSTTGLPSKKPFTDTNDVYVQALNAAGIIEGYFSNGTTAYKPNNTLTRGQVSAIVWRMQNYNQ